MVTLEPQKAAPPLDIMAVKWLSPLPAHQSEKPRVFNQRVPTVENVYDFRIDPQLGLHIQVDLVVKKVSEGNYPKKFDRPDPMQSAECKGGFLARLRLNGTAIGGQFNGYQPCDVIQVIPLDTPRGIAKVGTELIASTDRELVFLDAQTLRETRRLNHPQGLFARLHNCSISADNKRGLVTATGFGAVFEFDLQNLEITRSWLPWEQGLETVTSANATQTLGMRDGKVILTTVNLGIDRGPFIDECRNGVNPSSLASPVNSVSYDWTGERLFNLHYLGQVWRVSDTNDRVLLIENLAVPHGFQPDSFVRGYRVVNSNAFLHMAGHHNSIMWFDRQLQPLHRLDFTPGKHPASETWLQSSTLIDENDGVYLVIDATTDCIHIINMTERTRRQIRYPGFHGSNSVMWRPHEMILAPEAPTRDGEPFDELRYP